VHHFRLLSASLAMPHRTGGLVAVIHGRLGIWHLFRLLRWLCTALDVGFQCIGRDAPVTNADFAARQLALTQQPTDGYRVHLKPLCRLFGSQKFVFHAFIFSDVSLSCKNFRCASRESMERVLAIVRLVARRSEVGIISPRACHVVSSEDHGC